MNEFENKLLFELKQINESLKAICFQLEIM